MQTSIKVAIIYGTRPELIKLAPLIEEVQKNREMSPIECHVISSGQHDELLEDALQAFKIHTDLKMKLMTPNQNSGAFLISAMSKFLTLFEIEKYSLIVVHGDTGTAAAAAIAAHHCKIPIAHLEAGLRSCELWAPWPEESNRRIIDSIASLHFAPTASSFENLKGEGHEATSFTTGNTVVDATRMTLARIHNGELFVSEEIFEIVNRNQKSLILVTQHRRENFGAPLQEIISSLKILANLDVHIVFPVHPNPNVQELVKDKLGNFKNISLIDPVSYQDMIFLVANSKLIITDSGGLQEEGPTLGVPVLVTRDKTERPEGIVSGSVKLVGTNSEKIVCTATDLLQNEETYSAMSTAQNPYGDGKASMRIKEVILNYLEML